MKRKEKSAVHLYHILDNVLLTDSYPTSPSTSPRCGEPVARRSWWQKRSHHHRRHLSNSAHTTYPTATWRPPRSHKGYMSPWQHLSNYVPADMGHTSWIGGRTPVLVYRLGRSADSHWMGEHDSTPSFLHFAWGWITLGDGSSPTRLSLYCWRTTT